MFSYTYPLYLEGSKDKNARGKNNSQGSASSKDESSNERTISHSRKLVFELSFFSLTTYTERENNNSRGMNILSVINETNRRGRQAETRSRKTQSNPSTPENSGK